MAAYFISDIHLKPYKDERTSRLCSFMDHQIEDATHLFLMGDIFDFWMGPQIHWATRYQDVVRSIEGLRRRGVEVYFFEGNHDMHLKKYFNYKLGVHVVPGHLQMSLFNKNLRLEHGDQFDPYDTGYVFLRWLLRTPIIHFASTNVSGAFVAAIGDWGSAKSGQRTKAREFTPVQIENIKQKCREFAKSRFAETEYDALIFGHTHIKMDEPLVVQNKKAQLINLGSWFQPQIEALRLDTNGFSWIPIN